MDAGLVAAYAALGFSVLAAGTMVGATLYYFVNLLREPDQYGASVEPRSFDGLNR